MNKCTDLRKPLYIVSAGELGTDTSALDKSLTKIFALIPVWNAVVLIDEADVFLEERAVANIERNAMVAVFLRQLEYVHGSSYLLKTGTHLRPRYFCGILFLTTNRVKVLDQAFQSRIHLSLHYADLSRDAKEHLWRAFLEKARNTQLGLEHPAVAELRLLSEKGMNGRQIKNAVKLAFTLADHLKERLSYKHLVQTMDAMEDPQKISPAVSDFRPLGYLGLAGLGFVSACVIRYISVLHSK